MFVYVKTKASLDLPGIELDLEEFACYDDMMDHVREIFTDFSDHELIFEAGEDFPDFLITEGQLHRGVYSFEVLEDYDREIVVAYVANVGLFHRDLDDLIDEALEAYRGEYDSDEEFAEELFCEIYEIPSHLESYIDWAAVARDLMMDYFESDGRYFRSM